MKKTSRSQSQKTRGSVKVEDLKPATDPRGGKPNTADKLVEATDKVLKG